MTKSCKPDAASKPKHAGMPNAQLQDAASSLERRTSRGPNLSVVDGGLCGGRAVKDNRDDQGSVASTGVNVPFVLFVR